jgi:hypothetical protein
MAVVTIIIQVMVLVPLTVIKEPNPRAILIGTVLKRIPIVACVG